MTVFKVGDRVIWNPRYDSSMGSFGETYTKRVPGVIKRVSIGGNYDVLFDDGKTHYVNSARLLPEPTPPVVKPTRPLAAGDRVQFKRDAPINTRSGTWLGNDHGRGYKRAFEADLHGKLTSTRGGGGSVTWDDGTSSEGILLERLQHEEAPKTMAIGTISNTPTSNSTDRARAMTIEQARDERNKLIMALDLNLTQVIVRTRSWSHDGVFAAVEIPHKGAKLYTVPACAAYIEEQQPVIDAFAEKRSVYGTGWAFTTERGVLVGCDDGTTWWEDADIRRVKGIATFEGKRYRLCVKVVRPMYEEGKASLTTK